MMTVWDPPWQKMNGIANWFFYWNGKFTRAAYSRACFI